MLTHVADELDDLECQTFRKPKKAETLNYLASHLQAILEILVLTLQPLVNGTLVISPQSILQNKSMDFGLQSYLFHVGL